MRRKTYGDKCECKGLYHKRPLNRAAAGRTPELFIPDGAGIIDKKSPKS